MKELQHADEMNVVARNFNNNQSVSKAIATLQKEIYERASQGEFYLETKSLFNLSYKQLEMVVEKLKSLDYRFEVIGDNISVRFHKIIWGLNSDLEKRT
ncbi:hypothetical protein IM753_03145 [Moraxella sp. K127]|uniref:hypothetical protein n=1 Tax=Moraxella sp. K127 TaxID=2780079 RepID=UPI00187FE176|nr:hypothetical protein [Moraxella sp. K127]MBE9589987.1 hypothetical protein [Moraxella sp. K127]